MSLAAFVGVDDETEGQGSGKVRFLVVTARE